MSGDERAFEGLVDRYEKKLFNAAYRLTHDYEDAMDATQAAFVKAFEKIHTFDPSHRFFSWMYRIVVNESLNLLKQRKRREKLDEEFRVPEDDPEQHYDRTETTRHVESALMDLKTDDRIVIVLKHFHDFSYRDMSDILEVPEKTIKSRLFTARKRLKDILLRKGIAR